MACVPVHVRQFFFHPFKCKRGSLLSNTIICHWQDERGKNRQKSRDQSWTSSVLITLNPPHFSSPPALFEEPVILKSGSLGCQVSLRQQQVRSGFQPLGISRRPRYRLLPVFQRCAGAFRKPQKPNGSASPRLNRSNRCREFRDISSPPHTHLHRRDVSPRRSNVSLRL